jgi:hypothetical protein
MNIAVTVSGTPYLPDHMGTGSDAKRKGPDSQIWAGPHLIKASLHTVSIKNL